MTAAENRLRVALAHAGPTPIKAAEAQALKTHCPKGHPYDDQNTQAYTKPNGVKQRKCRVCDRERKRLARAAA